MREILLHYILYWSPCFVLCYVVNPGHNFPLHRWPFSCHSPLGSARAKKRAFGQQQKQKRFTCVEITNIFQQNEHSLGSGSPQVKLDQQSVPQHISRCFSWVPSTHPIGKDHMQCQLRCFSLHTKTYFNCFKPFYNQSAVINACYVTRSSCGALHALSWYPHGHAIHTGSHVLLFILISIRV